VTDSRTIGVYDAMADEYDRMFERTEPDRHLSDFLDLLPASSHVLDLGCGPGRSAAFMMEAGHTVDAVDACEAFVVAARNRGVLARKATFHEIGGSELYGGVWANFSLLHAVRDDFVRHLSAISSALIKRGVLHLGMKEGVGERRDKLGRLYTYYSEYELRGLVKQAGLEVISVKKGKEAGLAGDVEPWVIMVAHA
jgi:SAM-dependent methyltransferase